MRQRPKKSFYVNRQCQHCTFTTQRCGEMQQCHTMCCPHLRRRTNAYLKKHDGSFDKGTHHAMTRGGGAP